MVCIYICAHVKDRVVHVRVRLTKETPKHPACTVGWVSRLCRSWLSPEGEKQPEFPMGEIASGQYCCKKKSKNKKVQTDFIPLARSKVSGDDSSNSSEYSSPDVTPSG